MAPSGDVVDAFYVHDAVGANPDPPSLFRRWFGQSQLVSEDVSRREALRLPRHLHLHGAGPIFHVNLGEGGRNSDDGQERRQGDGDGDHQPEEAGDTLVPLLNQEGHCFPSYRTCTVFPSACNPPRHSVPASGSGGRAVACQLPPDDRRHQVQTDQVRDGDHEDESRSATSVGHSVGSREALSS